MAERRELEVAAGSFQHLYTYKGRLPSPSRPVFVSPQGSPDCPLQNQLAKSHFTKKWLSSAFSGLGPEVSESA